MKRREFLFGAAGSLLLALGACARRKWSAEDTRFAVLQDAAARSDIDVCIIGSGPAGSALAIDLLSAGKRVVILESGSAHADTVGMARAQKLDAYETFGLDYPLADTRVRAVGGTTAVWTGRTPRMLPGDFEPHPLTPPDNPWPFGYEDLKPYYRRAEQTLHVVGSPMGAGRAPRDRDLPGPPLVDISEMRILARRAGLTVDFPPFAQRPDPAGKEPIRFARDVLPALSRHRDLALVPGATAVGFDIGSSGRVTSVHAKTYSGIEHEVRARAFVIACGAVETTRLLLRSRTPAFPNGLGNGGDRVGRHFMEHPYREFAARVPGSTFSRWQVGRTYEHCAPLRAAGSGGISLALYGRPKGDDEITIKLGIEMRPDAANRIVLSDRVTDRFGDAGAALHMRFTDDEERLWERGDAIVRSLFAKLGSGGITAGNTVGWPHHHLGGARTGKDRATSVVDPE
ncbi:MAG: GMC family oxidoreductase, partial [Gemmatimonadetes bacterium]|nr:GMC family oxidoreductase [Gemmatimonadota bacterium]